MFLVQGSVARERDKEDIQKIQSMTENSSQKMSTLTVVKTVENSPTV